MTTLYCVIVAECGRFCLGAIEALIASNVRITEIWAEHPERFDREARKTRLLQLNGRLQPLNCGHIVKQRGIRVRRINRPAGPSLDEALAEAPPFDLLLCAGSHIIFPGDFLDKLDGRAFNLHPALLPHFRGPLPLHALVLKGAEDLYGGMTLHQLSAGIDEGPIVGQRQVRLSDAEDHIAWFKAIEEAITPLLRDDLMAHLRGEQNAIPQPPDSGSYFSAGDLPIEIQSGVTFDYATNLLTRGPRVMRYIRAVIDARDGEAKRLRVRGLPERLGPVAGKPARITPTLIEMDLADARVRLQRDHWPRRQSRKLRNLVRPRRRKP